MNSEKLIELVRQNELLYNFNDKKYYDNNEKDIVWRDISRKLNLSERECKKHWSTLRDSFRRRQKKRNSLLSEDSTASVKKWRYEDEMSFLLPYLSSKDKPTNSFINMAYSSNEEIDDHEMNDNLEVSSVETVFFENKTENDTNIPLTNLLKANSQQESTTAMMLKFLLEEKSKTDKQDEIDTLFHSLAQTVKKLNPYYCALAKAKVCSIVTELELKNLTNPVPVPDPHDVSTSVPSSSFPSTTSSSFPSTSS